MLLFVLWYCHKRGREVRLERELSGSAVEAGSRIEELSDSDSAVGAGTTRPAIESRKDSNNAVLRKRVPEPAGSTRYA